MSSTRHSGESRNPGSAVWTLAFAGAAMAMSSVSVVTNSLLMRRYRAAG